MDKVSSMLGCSLDDYTIVNGITTSGGTIMTVWDYWQDCYYPQVIYRDYPVYLRERAYDNGKKAFELIKILKDKKFIKLEKVSDFIDLMDELIKIL